MPREDVEKIIRQEPLENLYNVGNELGRGKFAIVKKCTEKSTGEPFAVKVLKKRRRGKSCRDDILLEIDIMRQANESREHPRIIRLHEVFESSSEFHIVLELATGGELFRVIAIDPLPEDKAREVVYQIVDGVQHLHLLNIVHLDLKPENILLYRKGSLDIKIADFGLSVQVREGQEMKTLVGTAEYVSPEILNFEALSTFTDMWSIGALTYALLTGYSPFQGESHQETFLNVSQCDYDFDDDIFDVVSMEAKDFIEHLLVKAPKKRMTAAKCLDHVWMKARKNNLNSSTSSLDSALCMDSPSSVEPSPASSTSSSFSPAPSSTISHSNTTTTSTVTTSSSPVTPFSQPEDMSEVNKKLAHISSLATSSLSANEAASSSAIKLRDDEGSPTSTDSSTSTLKEAPSSENIPVLAGADVDSAARPSKERSSTPSESAAPSEPAAPKASKDKDKMADVQGVVITNGKDAGVVSKDVPKLRDVKDLLEDKSAVKDQEGKKLGNTKSDMKDTSKREENKLDMILNGVKTGMGGYNRTKKTDCDVKTSRFGRSKNYVSLESDRLTSNSTSRLPSSTSSSTDRKEQKAERRFGEGPPEEPVRNKDRCISPSVYDALAAPSSTGSLIESRGSSTSYLTGGRSLTLSSRSTRTASPALESYTGSRTTFSSRDRKDRNKSDSFDESHTLKDSSSVKNKEEDKPASQRASTAVAEKSASREERPNTDDASTSSESRAPKEKTSSFDARHAVKALRQDSAEKVQSPEPNNEMSERERKRLERMKRRGSVEKVMQMINKAKQQLSEERKTSTSDEIIPSVHEPSANEAEQVNKESPSVTPRVTSPTQLAPKSNTSSSKAKHRPTTPEPMSPTITNVKLLHSPERRTRRKSEGMRPIERHLMKMAPQGETLQEEDSSDEKEVMEAPSLEAPHPQSEEVKIVVPEDAKAIKLDEVGSKDSYKKEVVPAMKEVVPAMKEVVPAMKEVVPAMKEVVPAMKEVAPAMKEVAPAMKEVVPAMKDVVPVMKDVVPVMKEEEDTAKDASSNSDDMATPENGESFRQSSNSSPVIVKDPSTASTQSSTGATTPTATTERMDRGERASSRPTSRSSSRPSSRTEHRQMSGEKELSGTKNKPPSPVPSSTPTGQRPPSSTASKYTSCTANAFTINNSPFTAEETRPYTSVLRRSESTKSKSVSSLTRTPIDDAWRYESSTTYSPTRRLSATPVRGRGAEIGETPGRTSPSHGFSSPSSKARDDGEKESRGGRLTSRHMTVEESEKRKEKECDTLSGTQSAAAVNSLSRIVTNGSKPESSKNGKEERLLGISLTSKSPSSPRRFYVKREEMFDKEDVSSSNRSAPSTRIASTGEDTTSGLSQPIANSTGPEIVIQLPSISDETSQSLPSSSSQGSSSQGQGEVVLRTRKSKLSTPKHPSWRNTPEISPDVVDMILKGEIFDSDEESDHLLRSKLETCMEVDEEAFSPIKKFTPPGSRSSSRTGKHAPILKTSKPSSPENGHDRGKISTSSAPEKKVSINEETSWIEGREPLRRKFRSTGDKSCILRERFYPEEVPVSKGIINNEEDLGGVTPLPDPLSISMDMRCFSLSRLRANSLSHSSSTPDLTQITGLSKKDSKARRVERSNSKRQFGRVRVDTYLDQASTQRVNDPQTPTSPRSGTVILSPRHSGSSLSSRIKSSFSRWGERDRDKSMDIKCRGSRTLK